MALFPDIRRWKATLCCSSLPGVSLLTLQVVCPAEDWSAESVAVRHYSSEGKPLTGRDAATAQLWSDMKPIPPACDSAKSELMRQLKPDWTDAVTCHDSTWRAMSQCEVSITARWLWNLCSFAEVRGHTFAHPVTTNSNLNDSECDLCLFDAVNVARKLHWHFFPSKPLFGICQSEENDWLCFSSLCFNADKPNKDFSSPFLSSPLLSSTTTNSCSPWTTMWMYNSFTWFPAKSPHYNMKHIHQQKGRSDSSKAELV